LKFFKFLLLLSFGADGAYLLPTSHLPLTLLLYHKAFVLSRTFLTFSKVFVVDFFDFPYLVNTLYQKIF